jgi:hypothetical protein
MGAPFVSCPRALVVVMLIPPGDVDADETIE